MKIWAVLMFGSACLLNACTTAVSMTTQISSETPKSNAIVIQSPRSTFTPLVRPMQTQTPFLTPTIKMTVTDVNQPLEPCLMADFPAAGTYADYLTPRNLFAWSPDGHTLAYVSATEHSFDLPIQIRFTPGTPINTLEILASGEVNNLAWSPDRSRLAFSVLRREDQLFTILVVRADGTDIQDLMPGETARNDAGIGTKFIYSWWGENHLLVLAHCGTGCTKPLLLDLRHGTQTSLFQPEREGEYLGVAYTWSPDKKWVVVLSGARPQLGIAPGDGGKVTWLSGPGAMNPNWESFYSFSPTWAPDSSRFAFLRQPADVSRPPELWVWEVGSNNVTYLLDGAVGAAWSPGAEDYIAVLTLVQPKLDSEGSWRGVYASRDGPNLLGMGVYRLSWSKMVNFEELGEITLGFHEPGDISSKLLLPIWSPDGLWIGYRDAQDNARVLSLSDLIQYEVDTQGEPVAGITWSPNNEMLAVTTLSQLWIYTIQCSP
jgi:WD40 repeat protein